MDNDDVKAYGISVKGNGEFWLDLNEELNSNLYQAYIFIMGYRIKAVHQILVLVVQVRILVAQLIKNRENLRATDWRNPG